MLGVRISDIDDRNILTVDLEKILELFAEAAESSEWQVSDVEATGDAAAGELHQLSDVNAKVPGSRLMRLASEINQIIDGTFSGYRSGESEPWIVISAVDSSFFEVLTDDLSVLNQVRKRFNDVEDPPSTG